MIGLDTNILVRYLAQDDPVQSPQATDLIERHLTEDEPGFVSVVTMAEIARVLSSVHRLANSAVADTIERVLQAGALVVENEQEVFTAMIAVREARGTFGDALIVALGAKAGCSHTLTFDRRAARLAGFQKM